MYRSFYGLQDKPFSILPNPSNLYLGVKHKTALFHLEYGLAEHAGFVLLTGEVGTGKTTLIRRLLRGLPADVQAAVVYSTNVTSSELLKMILHEFEIDPAHGDKSDSLELLNSFLINLFGRGKRALLIVDEAQSLPNEALEEIRMLSNLQTETTPLLQIMLVGQPELKSRLQHPSLSQLAQRITVSFHLGALTREETAEYVGYRLQSAGSSKKNLFTPDALDWIHQAAEGIPRSINILCDAALVYGYADEAESITRNIIEQVIKDKQASGLFSRFDISAMTQFPAQDVPTTDFAASADPLVDKLQRLETKEERSTADSTRQSLETQEHVEETIPEDEILLGQSIQEEDDPAPLPPHRKNIEHEFGSGLRMPYPPEEPVTIFLGRKKWALALAGCIAAVLIVISALLLTPKSSLKNIPTAPPGFIAEDQGVHDSTNESTLASREPTISQPIDPSPSAQPETTLPDANAAESATPPASGPAEGLLADSDRPAAAEVAALKPPLPTPPSGHADNLPGQRLLGVVSVGAGESLGGMTQRVYGYFNPTILARLLEENQHLSDPDNILQGESIRFPALRTQVVHRSPSPYWVQILEKESLPEAFAVLREYPVQPPSIRMIPFETPQEGLKFRIILKEFFSDPAEARRRMTEIAAEVGYEGSIINQWPAQATFFADPYLRAAR